MSDIAIYLAGKIQKAHEEPNETYWTEKEQRILREHLCPLAVHFLNPAIRTDDLSDQRSVFGRDMTQVFTADVILVDARDRRGLGVGAEMMWAKMNQKPVVTFAPKGSHYHKESTSLLGVNVKGWIHPFVESLSDLVAESLQEAADWIKAGPTNIKGPTSIHEAMQYYMQTQYAGDQPMQELAKSHTDLHQRLQTITN